MKIGIDISQMAYGSTGVGNFLRQIVSYLTTIDTKNSYILFYSSLRKKLPVSFVNDITSDRVKIKQFIFPPTLLDILWNKLHTVPIEYFIGTVDIFITSDWTEPPTEKARKATIIYDLIVYKFPLETDKKIIAVQKRKLAWVKKESDIIFCISKATKKDVQNVLAIQEDKIHVIYPGI
jgi:hypothetical protein